VTEFKPKWWSVEIPKDWIVSEEADPVTISDPSNQVAVQISAARKDSQVTDADLLEFASERLGPNVKPKQIKTSYFAGLFGQHTDPNFISREWWLRSGDLMLYVTFTRPIGIRSYDENVLEKLIDSLKPMI
jgi:hypothetical protein